jgi:hypothetical protein
MKRENGWGQCSKTIQKNPLPALPLFEKSITRDYVLLINTRGKRLPWIINSIEANVCHVNSQN